MKWSVCATKRDISLHNIQRNIWKIRDGRCWHVWFVAFVTFLLNRPHLSRQFIYFKALFSCKRHQGKIYKTQRVLVANLVTNFWILVASTISLVALATVLGSISCPELYTICENNWTEHNRHSFKKGLKWKHNTVCMKMWPEKEFKLIPR